MQFFECNPAFAVSLLHAPTFLQLFWSSRTLRVEWRVSNAWNDESCTAVCSNVGFQCTEGCWPTNTASMQAMVSTSPLLNGVCYDSQAGPAATWHPAKDPQNTMCYWNPGTASGSRCATVPTTPAASAAQNQFIRRFCPCVNTSSVVHSVSDCGLGSAANTPTPPAVPSSASNGALFNGCTELCVAGFGGLDKDLNGAYVAVTSAGLFSHWSRQVISGVGGTLQISKTNGRWQFAEVTPGGTSFQVAQSNSYAFANSQIPLSDTYNTARTSYELSFSCCGSGTSNNAQNSSAEKSSTTTIVLLSICALFGACAILAAAMYLRWWSRRQAVVAQAFSPKHDPSKLESNEPSTSPNGGMDHSKVSSGQRASNHDHYLKQDDLVGQIPESQMQQSFDHPPHVWVSAQPPGQSPAQRSSKTSVGALPQNTDTQVARSVCAGQNRFSPPPFRNKYSDNSHNQGIERRDFFHPPLVRSRYSDRLNNPGYSMSGNQTQVRSDSSGQENQVDGRAAKEIAAVLSDGFSSKYEGTLARRVIGSDFEEGHEVRIVGLDNEPTWDGAEGIVDGHDPYEGLVRILFPDGRTKSVSERNCEPAWRTPAPSNHALRSAAQGDASPAGVARVHPRGGIMAKPQGTVTLRGR